MLTIMQYIAVYLHPNPCILIHIVWPESCQYTALLHEKLADLTQKKERWVDARPFSAMPLYTRMLLVRLFERRPEAALQEAVWSEEQCAVRTSWTKILGTEPVVEPVDVVESCQIATVSTSCSADFELMALGQPTKQFILITVCATQ